MKNIKWLALILAAAMLTSVVGCASTPTHDSTGQYVDDSVITTKVKSQILDDLTLKGFEIKVETFKGVVQLSGFVSSQVNIDAAIAVARNVKGVRGVTNSLQLKSSTAG
jgi:hyperosmotically inducible protein